MRIVVLGMADSSHVSRWHSNNHGSHEILFFPTGPNRRVSSGITQILSRPDSKVRASKVVLALSLLIWFVDLILPRTLSFRSWLIGKAINSFQPDIVHCMETQHAGYLLSNAFQGRPSFPFVTILTLFGNDLFWFRDKPDHKKQLKNLLHRVDMIIFECERDLGYARELGFKGKFLGPMIAAGVVEETTLPDIAQGPRNIVSVKGYTGRWGLAHKVLSRLNWEEIERLNLRVVVFSASLHSVSLAWFLRRIRGRPVTSIRKFALEHEEMLDLFSRSRLYIGASRSDGLPQTFVESSLCGAYPLQTESACVRRFIKQNENGIALKISLTDFEDAFRKAVIASGSPENYQQSNRQMMLDSFGGNKVAKLQRGKPFYDFLKLELRL